MVLERTTERLRETSVPLIQEDGSVHLSGTNFSAIDMWLRCGKQYEFRYVNGQRQKPGIALAEGTGHHHAVELDNKSKKEHGKQLKPAHMVELFQSKFDEEVAGFEKQCEEDKYILDWRGDTRDGILKRGKTLQTEYVRDYSHTIQPDIIEEPFIREVEVDGVEFKLFGQTDLTTKTHLLDYKTSKRKKSQGDIDNHLQLSLYSWAKKMKKVGLVVFVKEKPHIQYIESTRTAGQWMYALKVVASAVKSIRQGSFPLTNPGQFPPPWWCSPTFCGYWKDCRGKFEKK
ncbi:hypothetical protein [uncultured Mediterranean phage]|nr:hypothetical protein [uncultured Mediterranean phage]